MNYRVLVTDNLSQTGVDLLKEQDGLEVDVRETLPPDELRKALADYDGIIIRSATKLTPEILEGQKRLKVVVRAGVGRGQHRPRRRDAGRHHRDEHARRQHDQHGGAHHRHDVGPLAEHRPRLRRHAGRQMGPQKIHRHPAFGQNAGRRRAWGGSVWRSPGGRRAWK